MRQLRWMWGTNKIMWDLSLRWVLDGYPILQKPLHSTAYKISQNHLPCLARLTQCDALSCFVLLCLACLLLLSVSNTSIWFTQCLWGIMYVKMDIHLYWKIMICWKLSNIQTRQNQARLDKTWKRPRFWKNRRLIIRAPKTSRYKIGC